MSIPVVMAAKIPTLLFPRACAGQERTARTSESDSGEASVRGVMTTEADFPSRDQKTTSSKRGDALGMTHSPVTIQITPTSVPSTPTFLGEVAAFAQVLTHVGILK